MRGVDVPGWYAPACECVVVSRVVVVRVLLVRPAEIVVGYVHAKSVEQMLNKTQYDEGMSAIGFRPTAEDGAYSARLRGPGKVPPTRCVGRYGCWTHEQWLEQFRADAEQPHRRRYQRRTSSLVIRARCTASTSAEARGHERSGRRLGLVISPSAITLSVVTVIPTSTSARPAIHRPELDIAGRTTTMLISQIRSIDTDYLVGDPVDYLSRDELARVGGPSRTISASQPSRHRSPDSVKSEEALCLRLTSGGSSPPTTTQDEVFQALVAARNSRTGGDDRVQPPACPGILTSFRREPPGPAGLGC